MYSKSMMFTDIIHCFLANVILGIATVRYGFKDNGMPGVLYTLLAVSASVFWTVSGICFLHFENNCWGQMGFFAWTAMPCLPWIFLCRKKYKFSKPYFLRLGIAGILTHAAFFAGVTYLAVTGNWQEALEYDISRYCGIFLLLFAVPAFLLNSLAFWFKEENWKCPDIASAMIALLSAIFFFAVGAGALRISV